MDLFIFLNAHHVRTSHFLLLCVFITPSKSTMHRHLPKNRRKKRDTKEQNIQSKLSDWAAGHYAALHIQFTKYTSVQFRVDAFIIDSVSIWSHRGIERHGQERESVRAEMENKSKCCLHAS
jgi:hypothetical protein